MKKIVPALIALIIIMILASEKKAEVDNYTYTSIDQQNVGDMIYQNRDFNAGADTDIIIDCSDSIVDIYMCKKEEISIQTSYKTVRTGDKGYDIKKDGNEISINMAEKNENTDYKSNRITIKTPALFKSITIKAKNGTFNIYDDIYCNMNMDITGITAEIEKISGTITAIGDKSSIYISSGKLKNGTDIQLENGNIDIIASLETKGTYVFKTRTGYVNLQLPLNTQAFINTEGYVARNDFDLNTKTQLDIIIGTVIGKTSIIKRELE